jgi:soluble cytochrome b562
MRRQAIALFLAASIAALASVSVRSAEAELGTDLMQAIEDSNKSLASNIAQKDAKASLADAKDIHQAFIQVEAFFAAKPDAHDAVELSKKTRDLTDAIAKAVGEGRFDAAQDTATELSRTCRTCHTFYKKS